jgi:glutamate dehydrogenase (NADP+)
MTVLEDFMAAVGERSPGEPEFHQAVEELAESVIPLVENDERLRSARILERMTEPDRIVSFRVTWEDDQGVPQINRGYRVQFNQSLGPYKGGLRFHPNVCQSVLKFLGFEQTFKNALTTLPMGGGKGGADFDPKEKSDREVMRFCQSFMTELYRYIGDAVDTPAGDIGVGAREIGYLFGQYTRIVSSFSGVLTGKGLDYGGSHLRPEATGYGLSYFIGHMADDRGIDLTDSTVAISGSGNVATFAVEKLTELGARVVTMSDSSGTIVDRDGIDPAKLAWIRELKEVRRGRLGEFVSEFGGEYLEGETPWGVPVDIAAPCATQNELAAGDAASLIEHGVKIVAEGANMPTTNEAVHLLREAGISFGPGKACNAGGVAVSGLEQSQNAVGLLLPAEEIDRRLRDIMRTIHRQCVEFSPEPNAIDYVTGANRAGFTKVANAMLSLGFV